MKKALIVASGGLDSTTALYWAKSKYDYVEAVTFKYGANHNQQEHKALEKTCKMLGIKLCTVDLPLKDYLKSSLLEGEDKIPLGRYDEESMKSTVVPFRNGIMLAIAAGIAESKELDDIVLGNHAGDHTIYPDCRPEFINNMSKAIEAGTWANVHLVSPFCNMTKGQITKLGASLGVDFKNTYSCYKGKEKHCGKCGTCVERKEAFELAGIEDPTEYEV